MNIKQIRYHNARTLVGQAGGITAFANKLDKSQSQASQIAGENPIKGIGDKVAKQIEMAFNMPVGWLDQRHEKDGVMPGQLFVPVFTDSDIREPRADYAVGTIDPGGPCGKKSFVVTLTGDEHFGFITPGSRLLIDPDQPVAHGQYGLFYSPSNPEQPPVIAQLSSVMGRKMLVFHHANKYPPIPAPDDIVVAGRVIRVLARDI